MINYYEINEKIKQSFELNKEYAIKQIISDLSGFDPLNVKAVITQGIMNNNYVIIHNKTPFINSIIKLASHQIYPENDELIKKTNLTLSVPPYHKSTMNIAFEKAGFSCESLYDSFVTLIKSAKNNIFICSPFFDLRKLIELQNLIIKKATEGVKITILTRNINHHEGKDSPREKALFKFKSRLNTDRLKENIKIKNYHFEGENQSVLSSVHSKILIIDESKAYIGSGEFRYNSFERNFELGIIIEDIELIKNLIVIFNSLFLIANEI